jgi:hypothetical protein
MCGVEPLRVRRAALLPPAESPGHDIEREGGSPVEGATDEVVTSGRGDDSRGRDKGGGVEVRTEQEMKQEPQMANENDEKHWPVESATSEVNR